LYLSHPTHHSIAESSPTQSTTVVKNFHPTRPNPTKHGWTQPMPVSESAWSFYLLLITKLVALVRRFNARGAHNFQSCLQFRLQLMALSTYRLGITVAWYLSSDTHNKWVRYHNGGQMRTHPIPDGASLAMAGNCYWHLMILTLGLTLTQLLPAFGFCWFASSSPVAVL